MATGTPATSTTSTVDAAGSRLSVTQGTVSPSTACWTLFDQLGSVAALVGPSGSLTAAYRFDGYGNSITAGARATDPFGFAGALDLGTDGQPLYAMGARLYAPSAGVFTSMDTYAGTAADPASMNRFLYAAADPTTLVDPTGHNAVYEGGGCGPNGIYCGNTSGSGGSYRPSAGHVAAKASTPRPQYDCPAGRCHPGAGAGATVDNTPKTVPAVPTRPATVAATVYATLPSGPVDLTHLQYGSEDWGRLLDWCSAVTGGASLSPGACDFLANGVSRPGLDPNQVAATVGDVVTAAVLAPGLLDGATEGPESELLAKLGDDVSARLTETEATAAEDVFAGSGASWEGKAAASGTTTPAAQLPQDASIAGRDAPDPLATTRSGGGSPTQNAAVQGDVAALVKMGAEDVKVNQWQADINGNLAGRNRPDLQFTYNGQRYYIEYDVPSSDRGPAHAARIMANDPGAIVYTLTVP